MNNFKKYSRYYDLLYSDKDYLSESNYIINKIRLLKPNASSILELGCGSGSHAFHFCKTKFEVLGIEKSSDMATSAIDKKINGLEVVTGDISQFSLNKKFDAALALYHVISYLTDNSSLLSCFKHTSNHLKQDGIFIFDVWYMPAVLNLKPTIRVREFENDELKLTRTSEPVLYLEKNTVEVNFELVAHDKSTGINEIINELHPMRYFSIPEIELLASLSGFQVLEYEEFLTGRPTTNDTWGVCFTLRKVSSHQLF